jgi:HEAT repeat protein
MVTQLDSSMVRGIPKRLRELAMQDRAAILGDLLDSSDRVLVIETLKSIKNARTEWAVPSLIVRLKSCSDPSSRAALAWTLGAYPKNASVQDALLEVMAGDSDQAVRDHAIESLGDFRSPVVLNARLRVLEQGSASERFWSLYSLGKLADSQASAAITRCLHDQTVIPHFGTVADEARWALEKITRRIRRGPARRKTRDRESEAK